MVWHQQQWIQRKKERKSKMINTKEDISFEAALNELEQITNQLKDGQVSLEDSLKLYDKGIQYYKICSEMLVKADQKIKIYNKDVNALEETK